MPKWLEWVSTLGLFFSPYIVCYTVFFLTRNGEWTVYSLLGATVLMLAWAFRDPGQSYARSLWLTICGLGFFAFWLVVGGAFLSGFFGRR